MINKTVRVIELVLAILIAALVLAEILLYVPSTRPTLSLDEQLTVQSNGTVTVVSTVESSFSAHLSLDNLVGNGSPKINSIFYYYDGNYPVSGADPSNWFGLPGHLGSIASARGEVDNIVGLNATQLASFLTSPIPPDSVLIVASGCLPDPVYSNNSNLVVPWLRAGGQLFWVGSPIGEFRGPPIDPRGPPFTVISVPNGSDPFLPRAWLGNSANLYLGNTSASSELGYYYPYAWPGQGFNISLLEKGGGLPLGNIDSHFTNVARIPESKGTLVDFSAPSIDVVRLAFAMQNLLDAGLHESSYRLLGGTTVSLSSGESATLTQNVPIPLSVFANTSAEFCRFTVQTDYLAPFGSVACIRL